MSTHPELLTDTPPARRLRHAWRPVFDELPQCSAVRADVHAVRELLGRIDGLPACALKLARLRRLERRLAAPVQLELFDQ